MFNGEKLPKYFMDQLSRFNQIAAMNQITYIESTLELSNVNIDKSAMRRDQEMYKKNWCEKYKYEEK